MVVDSEVAYVDPLYDCIVVERRYDDLLRQRAVRRLRALSQLGFGAYAFPQADHARFEHSLGVYHLARKLESSESISRTKVNFPALKFAALLHGIGHFPLAPACEVAYVKAARISRSLRHQIDEMLAAIAPAMKMRPEQLRRAIDRGKIDGLHPYRFYRLATAWRLCHDKSPLARAIKETPDCHLRQVLNTLLLRGSLEYKVMEHLDAVDHILRDAYHHGHIRAKLNLHLYVRSISAPGGTRLRAPAEWTAVRSMADYLNDQVYRDKSVKAAEAAASQAVLADLLAKKLKLDYLRKAGDPALRRHLEGRFRSSRTGNPKAIRTSPVLLAHGRFQFHYRSISEGENASAESILAMESHAKVPGERHRRRLARSASEGVFWAGYPLTPGSATGVGFDIVGVEPSSFPGFMREVSDYELRTGACSPERVAAAVWGSELDAVDNDRLQPLVPLLARALDRESPHLSQAFSKMLARQGSPDSTLEPLGRTELQALAKVTLRTMTSHTELSTWLARALTSRTAQLSRDLESHKFLGLRSRAALRRLMVDACTPAKNMPAQQKEVLLECEQYLKLVFAKREKGEVARWAYPSTRLRTRGEIDSWVVVTFARRRPLIQLNMTSVTDRYKKELEDREKLEQARSYLLTSLGGSAEVVALFNLRGESRPRKTGSGPLR